MTNKEVRKIVYVSGTRADFGLMRSTLQGIDHSPFLSLSIVVTGMHLDPAFGETWHEIEDTGLQISARVPVQLSPTTGGTTAKSIGQMLIAFTEIFEREQPDLLLVLGDRGEMLAAAIAAIHLNIFVAHIHGGERSGTIDEPIRHAITKLSHIHFAATEKARERLIRLGERADCIHVSGAPGIDGLTDMPTRKRNDVFSELGFNVKRPIALLLYHPVLQEAATAAHNTRAVFDGIKLAGWQALVLMPNADAGSDCIQAEIETENNSDFKKVIHLERSSFLEIMAVADAMIGNSSAGIIEAASFGTPVLNLGSRQNLRERNTNVIDLPENAIQIAAELKRLADRQKRQTHNIYGDGWASKRIVEKLENQKLDSTFLKKVLMY